MTFQEFLEKWNGKYCEVAGSAGAENQCVDLANAYIRDVLGLPIIEWTNAVDFPSKADPNFYDWIPNGDTNFPSEGDLVIWGGTYGHIAIALSGADANRFKSFDQNYPSGSFCRVVDHSYSNVKGWLHPKGKQVTLDSATFENLVTKATLLDNIARLLNVPVNQDVILGELNKLISYEDVIIQKDRQINEAGAKITELEDKLTQLSFNHTELLSDHATLQQKLTDAEHEMNEQGVTISALTQDIESLKKQITTPVYKGWKKALIDLIAAL